MRIDLDLTPQIDRLPRRPGHQVLPARTAPTSITLHYSGVVQQDRSRRAELATLLSEARYHLQKNWSSVPGTTTYGDGIMYDLAVLSDGARVRLRARPQQLWHCGNAEGNATSIAVHVILGRDQDLTSSQRDSLFRLFDELRAAHAIPRSAVFGHNEWPRTRGAPRPSATYQLLPAQSECPGAVLHRHLVAYRDLGEAPAHYLMRLPSWVREAPSWGAPIAWGGSCVLRPGQVVELIPISANWLHWAPGGFVPASAVGPAETLDEPYSQHSPILGRPRASLAQAIRYCLDRPHTAYSAWDIVQVILPSYVEQCAALDLDPIVAIAQMVHETGNLSSWWCARPRRNPAGIGVTGDPGAGCTFGEWTREAIPAHLGRLLAYALPDDAPTSLAQEAAIRYALQVRGLDARARGSAPTLDPLGAADNPVNAGRPRGQWIAGWAWDGANYGEAIAAIANAIRETRV